MHKKKKKQRLKENPFRFIQRLKTIPLQIHSTPDIQDSEMRSKIDRYLCRVC